MSKRDDRFEVGDQARVIGNERFGHAFPDGTVVTLKFRDDEDGSWDAEFGGLYQWVGAEDIEAVRDA